jgi:hypothetical protein
MRFVDVDNPATLREHVHVGDVVKIKTKSGERIETKIIAITEESIVGENVRVATSDVAEIGVAIERPNPAWGIAAFIAVLVVIVHIVNSTVDNLLK